jgi:anti-sigma factor RsiW
MSKHLEGDWLAYREGRLEPATQARWDEHLAECARCRERAAEWGRMMADLRALPRALRGASGRAGKHWPEVWGRVQRAGGRAASMAGRMRPRLTVYLSLVAVTLSASAAWPGSLGGRVGAVTAGMVETPRAAMHTPQASGTTPSLTPQGTAPAAGQLALPVGPAAVETPAPGSPG